MANTQTILDILDDELGAFSPKLVDSLNATSLESLAGAVNDFYDSWSQPELDDGSSMYAGGWIVGNIEAEDAKQYLYTTLVYYPKTIIHDPLAEWFFKGRTSLVSPPIIKDLFGNGVEMSEPGLLGGDGYYAHIAEPERTKQRLKQAFQLYTELEPLIRAGIVVPIPHWQIVAKKQDAILTAVRYDIANSDFLSAVGQPADNELARGDRIRGAFMKLPMQTDDQAAIAAAQAISYFLNKTIALSDSAHSLYVPPTSADARLFEARVNRLKGDLASNDVELSLAPSLISAELPFLGSLDVKTLLAIRKNEDSFEDWRTELRNTVRTIRSSNSQGEQFRREAKDVLDDALLPRIRAIKTASSRSTALKNAAKEQGLTLTVGTGALEATSRVLNHGITDKAGLSALALSSVSRWLLSMLFRDSPTGSSAVLATLAKK